MLDLSELKTIEQHPFNPSFDLAAALVDFVAEAVKAETGDENNSKFSNISTPFTKGIFITAAAFAPEKRTVDCTYLTSTQSAGLCLPV